jgi:hypothetical protein
MVKQQTMTPQAHPGHKLGYNYEDFYTSNKQTPHPNAMVARYHKARELGGSQSTPNLGTNYSLEQRRFFDRIHRASEKQH